MRLFTEMSQATTDATKSPAAVANSSVYDIFLMERFSGTLRATRGPAWSSDTSRGTGAGTSEIDFTTVADQQGGDHEWARLPIAALCSGRCDRMARRNWSTRGLQRWVSNAYNAVPRQHAPRRHDQ
jgi:hypothetical protein